MELKPIPGTLGFLADSEGNIYDQNKVKVEPEENPQGSMVVEVTMFDGQPVVFQVERLIAFAFFDLPRPGYELVLHLDGDVSNNGIDNLQWASLAQKQLHHHVLNNPVTISMGHAPNEKTKQWSREFYSYRGSAVKSIEEVVEASGLELREIWDSIFNDKWVDEEQWKFSVFDNPYEVPAEEEIPPKSGHNEWLHVPESAVKCRDIDTGVVILFPTMAQAGKHFHLSATQIYRKIPRDGRIRLFKDKFQFAFVDEDFVEPNELDARKAKNSGPKDVVAYCFDDGRVYLFDSVESFTEHSGCDFDWVAQMLYDEKLQRFGRWVFTYYDNEYSTEKLLDYVKGSSPDVTPK